MLTTITTITTALLIGVCAYLIQSKSKISVQLSDVEAKYATTKEFAETAAGRILALERSNRELSNHVRSEAAIKKLFKPKKNKKKSV